MKDIKIKLKNAGKFIVLKMIRLYQLAISPYKGGKYCSFIPTCSQYAIEAIEIFSCLLLFSFPISAYWHRIKAISVLIKWIAP